MSTARSPASAKSAEQLLAHLGWIQALARRLVRDPELADDLAQEACVVALEHHPEEERKVRRWLASVLRNLVRQHQRSDARRRAREERSARSEATASTAELVAEVAVQREIVANVLELDEPYRSTVLLRYFRDLPPREIALRQGVPVNTVHSRLKRAHDKLRDRLDRSYGDRRAWSVCMAPLLFAKQGELLAVPSLGSTLGALVMNLKVVVTAVVLAIGAAALWTLNRSASPTAVAPGVVERPVELEVVAALPEPEERLGRLGEPGEAAPGRRALAATPAAPSGAAPAPAPVDPEAFQVRGRVLDGSGQPVAGLAVGQTGVAGVLARTDAGGNFQFETAQDLGLLVAADDGWVTVREGVWRRRSTYESVVIIAPAIELSGRILDAGGGSVGSARVSFQLPADFQNRFEAILEGSRERHWGTRADEDGSFRFDGIPGLEGALLVGSREGYLPASLEAPVNGARGLQLVLERPSTPLEGTLRGRVVDGTGAGLAAARVGLGLTTVLTDETGGFAIELTRAVTADRLIAVKAGFQPGSEERPEEPMQLADGTFTTGWPDFVVVALGAPALSIAGVVVDHEGRPKAGAKVWLADPTPFSPIGMMPANVEGLVAGARIPPQSLESEYRLPEEDGDDYWDFTSPANRSDAFWSYVETDSEGRFELPGLSDRTYRLNVFDEDNMALTTSAPIRAGEVQARIELERVRRAEELAGRVVDQEGDPVEGARLSLWVPVVERGGRIRGGRTDVTLTRRGPEGRTDADGRFSIADVPLCDLRIAISGDLIVPTSYRLAQDDEPQRLELSVHVRCHLQVVLGEDPERADSIAVRTADGGYLDVLMISHESFTAFTDVPLVAGQSGVVSVSSEARFLLLMRDGEVVEEHPLELRPGELNVLSL